MRRMQISAVVPFLLLLLAGCGKNNSNVQPDPVVPAGQDRDVFLRSWAGSSCRSTGYTITITRDPGDSGRIQITNLLNEGKTLIATVPLGGGSVSIPQQSYSPPDTAIGGNLNYVQGGTISFTVQKYIKGNPGIPCSGTGL